jgi:hypothetical protein
MIRNSATIQQFLRFQAEANRNRSETCCASAGASTLMVLSGGEEGYSLGVYWCLVS